MKTTEGEKVQNIELELSAFVLTTVKLNRKYGGVFSPPSFFGKYVSKLPMGWKWVENSRVFNGTIPGFPATGAGKDMAFPFFLLIFRALSFQRGGGRVCHYH